MKKRMIVRLRFRKYSLRIPTSEFVIVHPTGIHCGCRAAGLAAFQQLGRQAEGHFRRVGTVVMVAEGKLPQLLDQQPRAGAAALEAQAPGGQVGPQPADAHQLVGAVLQRPGPRAQHPLAAKLGLELAAEQVLKLVRPRRRTRRGESGGTAPPRRPRSAASAAAPGPPRHTRSPADPRPASPAPNSRRAASRSPCSGPGPASSPADAPAIRRTRCPHRSRLSGHSQRSGLIGEFCFSRSNAARPPSARMHISV